MLFNNNILNIKFIEECIDTRFVNYCFNSFYCKKLLNTYKSNTTKVCAIYQRDLFRLIIPLFPLTE